MWKLINFNKFNLLNDCANIIIHILNRILPNEYYLNLTMPSIRLSFGTFSYEVHTLHNRNINGIRFRKIKIKLKFLLMLTIMKEIIRITIANFVMKKIMILF